MRIINLTVPSVLLPILKIAPRRTWWRYAGILIIWIALGKWSCPLPQSEDSDTEGDTTPRSSWEQNSSLKKWYPSKAHRPSPEDWGSPSNSINDAPASRRTLSSRSTPCCKIPPINCWYVSRGSQDSRGPYVFSIEESLTRIWRLWDTARIQAIRIQEPTSPRSSML